MQSIKKDTITYDEFVVLDKHDNPVTGLVDGSFTRILFDPDGNEVANISGGITVSILELGNGVYRVNFTPDKLGNWILVVYNSTYFSWGKAQNYKCFDHDFDDITASINVNAIADAVWDEAQADHINAGSFGQLVQRIAGLSQENYRIFNTSYDKYNNLISGLVKVYPTANDVENDTNPIAIYNVSARFDKSNRMVDYKVKKA